MIELERATTARIPELALDINKLVRRDATWVRAVRPDTWTRYRNMDKAKESLGRIIADAAIDLDIIRQDTIAAGLGTTNWNAIHHPGENVTVEGRQIDYWALGNLRDDEHEQAALLLATQGGYTGVVLAVLTAAEERRARGIPLIMQPIGNPSHMEIPGDDPFYIAQIHEPLQLYTLEV